MSILLFTGFDASNALPPEIVSSSQMAVNVGAGRRGGNSITQTAGNGSSANLYWGGTNSHIVAGFALDYTAANDSNMGFCSFGEYGVVVHITLQIDSTHHLRVVRGGSVAGFNTGTLLGTTTGTLTLGSWNYIEVELEISDTVGIVKVWLNGQTSPDINLSSQDTKNGGTGFVDYVGVGRANSFTSMNGVDFDDFYVLNTSGSAPWNARLGDIRCDVQRPNANGTSNDSTPSTGTDRYATIDETTPSTTDYNSLTATSQKDTLNVANLAASGASIIAVKPILFALKSDAGTAEICPVVRSGSTDFDGTSAPLNTTATVVKQLYETDPNTSAQWTETNFNSAEFGYKRTA